jgi:hypothetical protein
MNRNDAKSAGPRNQNKASISNLQQVKSQLLRELRREMAPARGGQAKRPSQLRLRNGIFPQSPNLALSVAAPVSKGIVRRTGNPKQVSLPNGDILVTHREYLTDILGSTPFTVNQFPVNPGLPGSFPWLSAIAQRFESYIFEALKFDFETEAPTSTAGSAIISLDYDASDGAPTTKTQAMAFRSAVRSPSWSNCQLVGLKEDLMKRKSYFVRRGAIPANTDLKLYDTGNLNLCTIAQGNTNTLGELYVEYTCRLMTPQLGLVGQGESIYGDFSGTSNTNLASVINGNLPAVAITTGTTTSVTTWTFSQPWQGVISFDLLGTGLTTAVLSGTSTAANTDSVVNAAATKLIGFGAATVGIGQTIVLTIGNTTISSSGIFFSQGGN